MSRDHISLRMLYRMCKSGRIQCPRFIGEQEEHEWSMTEMSHFIETILMDLPVAPIIGSANFDDQIFLYDGRNKVQAIELYLDNIYSLENMRVLTAYNHLRFHELPQHLQSRILNFMVDLFVVGPNTPPELSDEVLGRMNFKPVNIL